MESAQPVKKNARSRSLLLCALLIAHLGARCSGGDGAEPSDGSTGDAITADRGVAVDPVTAVELREGCARATSCGVRAYPNLASCVNAYHELFIPQGLGPIYDALYRCTNAAAGECAKVEACFGARGPCDQSYQATCEGTVAVSCDLIDKREYAVDCAAAALSCAIKSDKPFTAACTRGSCNASYSDRCSGATHLSCAASVIEARDCSLDGLTCVEIEDAAGCAGTGEVSCREGTVTPFCEEGVAVSCEFVRVHRRDCAAEGLPCEDGKCRAPAPLCDDSMEDRCNDTKLEACIGDSWETIDCEALGLGPCAVEPAGYARCTAP